MTAASHSAVIKPEDRPTVGVFWMVVTGLCFVAVTALVKHFARDLPAAQSAFMRYALGAVFILPMLRPMLNAGITRRDLGIFVLRGGAHTIGVTLWFFSMTAIPIAEVTAMNYMSPVYVTLGAAFFLGEKLAFRRIAAVLVALIGALIIIRPGVREVSAGHLAMLFAGLVFGASYLITKILSARFSAAVIVGMLSVTVAIGLFPLAMVVWQPPTAEQVFGMFLVACFATAGHYTMTLAFAAAPVTVTQPVTFLQLIWAVLLGTLVFHESVDIWVILGGALILGAVTFITWREAMLKRRVVAPPHVATKV